MTKEEIRKFHKKLFSWWKTNARDLPWRKTNDPYCILVSEMMLQQTQVSRVVEKYLAFIERFPRVAVLARAPLSDVLREWKGLGYNRRAKYLHDCVKTIVSTHGGKFPETEQELLALPGIGRYTARAILVFAYKKDIAMVDTNIRQIITHHVYHDTKQSEKEIQRMADVLLPKRKSWEWHQALMDYGALALEKKPIRKNKHTNVPFRHSNRFLRGKIMDALRHSPVAMETLKKVMMESHKRSREQVDQALSSLQKEGLLVVSNGMVQLPE